MYDPRRGTWNGVDPLAEIDPSTNPFVFCKNNPVYYIDPMGLAPQASGSDSTQVVVIDPIVVTAPRPSNPLSNIFIFTMWSAYNWGKLYNDATGDRNASFNTNMFAGLNLWQSFALAYGLSKIFNAYKTTNTRNKVKWTLGKHKTSQKWINQMKTRGWTVEQISEAINKGHKVKSVNFF